MQEEERGQGLVLGRRRDTPVRGEAPARSRLSASSFRRRQGRV